MFPIKKVAVSYNAKNERVTSSTIADSSTKKKSTVNDKRLQSYNRDDDNNDDKNDRAGSTREDDSLQELSERIKKKRSISPTPEKIAAVNEAKEKEPLMNRRRIDNDNDDKSDEDLKKEITTDKKLSSAVALGIENVYDKTKESSLNRNLHASERFIENEINKNPKLKIIENKVIDAFDELEDDLEENMKQVPRSSAKYKLFDCCRRSIKTLKYIAIFIISITAIYAPTVHLYRFIKSLPNSTVSFDNSSDGDDLLSKPFLSGRFITPPSDTLINRHDISSSSTTTTSQPPLSFNSFVQNSSSFENDDKLRNKIAWLNLNKNRTNDDSRSATTYTLVLDESRFVYDVDKNNKSASSKTGSRRRKGGGGGTGIVGSPTYVGRKNESSPYDTREKEKEEEQEENETVREKKRHPSRSKYGPYVPIQDNLSNRDISFLPKSN